MIASIVVFLLVILIHEFGHFIIAKLIGVKVHEFSIGMGPEIFSKKTVETQYSLRLLPIGGYVALEGENEISDDPRSFSNVSVPKKLAVLFAGAFMNFVLAIVSFGIFLSFMGFPSTTVEDIIPDSPAAIVGIMDNDKIIEIDGNAINEWEDIPAAINSSENETLSISYERNGEIIESEITPVLQDGAKTIGIHSKFLVKTGNKIVLAFQETKEVVVQLYQTLWMLITNQLSLNVLSGPVGIKKIISQGAKSGVLTVVYLLGLISANLGVMNLLPLPALDGGQIIIILLEKIFGREIPEKIKIGINTVGFAFLMGLMLFITFRNDLKLGW
ncbi:MAG: RIP metalloprotease RseP [Tissierellia bacterium]|nr:RIP metalloprotease RseP [Tissierellia bacterium]